MTEAVHVQWHNRDQANASFATTVAPFVKQKLELGQRLLVHVEVLEDDRSLKQNAFYWKAVLEQIAQGATLGGVRYTADAWHEYFKRTILGYEIKKVAVAGSKRKKVIRRLKSTTGLSVRAMSKYLEQVQAFAATELGITFTVAHWESYEGYWR